MEPGSQCTWRVCSLPLCRRYLNGVLFTGGGLSLAFDTQYYQTAQMLYDLTLAANDAGDYMPLWGTWCVWTRRQRARCLAAPDTVIVCVHRVWGFVQSRSMGFQLLNILTSHNQSVLSTDAFDSYGVPLPLDLADGATASRFISAAPSDVLEWLTSDNITVNLHHDGVKPETFKSNAKLSSFYQMISTNKGLKGNVRALCAGCETCMRRLTLAVPVPAGIREHH